MDKALQLSGSSLTTQPSPVDEYTMTTTTGEFILSGDITKRLETILVQINPPRFVNIRHRNGRALIAVNSIMSIVPVGGRGYA